MGKRGEVYTDRLDIANGRRSYFFNVKENRNGDYFVNIVESIKRLDKFDRQEILVYEEHLEEFKEKIDNVLFELRRISRDKGRERGGYDHSSHAPSSNDDNSNSYRSNDSQEEKEFKEDSKDQDSYDY